MHTYTKVNNILAGLGGLLFLLSPMSGFGQVDQNNDTVSTTSTVNIPGTMLSMTLPNVFIYQPAQSAYVYAGAAASIAVKELNGTAYSSLLKQVTKNTIESQGMSFVESKEITIKNGQKGTMYTTSLSVKSSDDAKKFDYERIIFITGNQSKSALITMNYPMITKSLLSDVLKECLLTIEFD